MKSSVRRAEQEFSRAHTKYLERLQTSKREEYLPLSEKRRFSMTTLITRSPLQILSMTSMQRPSRRRNARHAFNEGNGDEDGEGNKEGYGSAPTKRTKVDGSSAKATVGAQTKSKKKNAG